MMEQSEFDKENHKRIKAVKRSFGASGKSLSKPGRILVGQGCLQKQSRRNQETKVFFLFNDVLVYGSIVLPGRLHRNLIIIPLENIQLDFVEDDVVLTSQWLIRTPSKSFFVSAHSHEEKEAWIQQIKSYQSNLFRSGRLQSSVFAVTLIPNQVAHKCMRCFSIFRATKRRYHCKKCGFLVCKACSKHRMLLTHINPTKKVRVCRTCHMKKEEDESARCRGDSAGRSSSEDEDMTSSYSKAFSN
ncbi:pleckstrin homology domain-containing family F member 1-like [Antennarius striatus]|uniref:pleckstrin homology domain-containing family F member 1-like n=1 Tax=Antennarius striatus TaxID=241820 RepID=UPI0035B37D31